jgi:hypothetical protein
MDSLKQAIDTPLTIAQMILATVTKEFALPGNPTWLWGGDVSCLMNRHIPTGGPVRSPYRGDDLTQEGLQHGGGLPKPSQDGRRKSF